MISRRWTRAAAVFGLCLAVATAGGCAAFEQGYQDGLKEDVSVEYGWGHELYEFPLGLVVLPVNVVLSPFIALVPPEKHWRGYLLGETWAGNRILLDPTTNYGG